MNVKLANLDERTQNHFKKSRYNEKVHCISDIGRNQNGLVYTYRYKVSIVLLKLLLFPFFFIVKVLESLATVFHTFIMEMVEEFSDISLFDPQRVYVESQEVEEKREKELNEIREHFSDGQ